MIKKEKLSKFVTTKSGKKVDKINCKLIDKEYYEKDTECINIIFEKKEKWFPLNHPDIGLDLTTDKYDHVKNLDAKGFSKFIVGFDEKNNPVFGYSYNTPFINVEVRSHIENIPDLIKKLQYEYLRYSENIMAEKQKLSKERLFNKNYNSFISCLAKLLYSKEIMNSTYDIEKLSNKDFLTLIDKVNEYILQRKENEKYYADFFTTYKILFSKEEPFIEEGYENKKITFDKLKEDPSLDKLFNIFLKAYSYEEGILNAIQKIEDTQKTLKKRIDEFSAVSYFKGKCRNKKEAIGLGFIAGNANDLFYLKKNISKGDLEQLSLINITYSDNVYKNIKMNYNANTGLQAFDKILNDYISLKHTRKITQDSYNVAKLLKGLSFGLEFETSAGRIRESDLSILGLIPLKDGSVQGFEYTTIPYGLDHNVEDGKKATSVKNLAEDLNILKQVCEELSERTVKNQTCSMHLHIGGNRTDKLYLIALYILCYKIQNEMFEMQPLFKTDPPKYAGLNKKYCDKLTDLNLLKNCIFDKSSVLKENYCNNVDKHFNNIFKFLSGGAEIGTKFNRKNHQHPFSKKWDRNARYHWVNFVNSVFSDTGTIEFRLHTGTSNFTKVLNWILICSAIVKYAETHMKEIISNPNKNIALSEILQGYSNNFRDKKQVNPFGLFVSNYLNAYVKERKMTFQKLDSQLDYLGLEDSKKDVEYSFNFNGVNSLM